MLSCMHICSNAAVPAYGSIQVDLDGMRLLVRVGV